VIAARGLTDPVWFMIADWFAIYLDSKGFSLAETAAGFWVPFLAADLGNFFGGGLSSHLIRRGFSVGRARKAIVAGGAFGVLALVPAAFLSDFRSLVACFAIATFSYAAMSTMALSFPADLCRAGRWRHWPASPAPAPASRHHRRDVPHRARRRPLLHADPGRGERRALRGGSSSSSSWNTRSRPETSSR
jgi:hypothetical protein